MIRRLLARLRHDRRGAALMEFALIAPVFMLLLMGMFDIGHQMYVKALLTGAVQKAGRDSMLQSGATGTAAIDAKVWAIVRRSVPNGTLTTTRTAYQDFANAGKPEPFVDGNSNAVRNAGECFQDINGNNTWDTVSGQAGQGGASDAVVYTATISHPHFFPLPSLLAMFPGAASTPMSTTATSTASTVLRNQPYDDDSQPRIICT